MSSGVQRKRKRADGGAVRNGARTKKCWGVRGRGRVALVGDQAERAEGPSAALGGGRSGTLGVVEEEIISTSL